jgi:polar amino acid transport system permease protein
MYTLDFSVLWGEWGWVLLKGVRVTLALAAWSLLFSVAIGFFFGVLRWVRLPLAEPICWLYVEFARTIPPLVQILFWYFSASYFLPAPVFGYLRNVGYEFVAAVVALSIYHGSFMAEVIRAGLNAVPTGQIEASRALGLGFPKMMRFVVLPQAVRIMLPPMTNEAVGLAKNTSLAIAIGVTEISYATKSIDSYTFRGVEALIAATVLYLAICLSLSALGNLGSRWLSRRASPIRSGRLAQAVQRLSAVGDH